MPAVCARANLQRSGESPGKAEHLPTGSASAGLSDRLKDGGDFGVGEAGDDGGDHHANGDAGGGEFLDGAKAVGRGASARFQVAG